MYNPRHEKYFMESPPKRRNPSFVVKTPSRPSSNGVENGFPIIKASEGTVLVTLGGIQLISGILMIAFGILTMLQESAMSSIGAGLWGGALGAATGVVGIVAGFKGCYRRADRISPLAVTVYLALSLVSIGVGNLALVLTATGLLRDSHRPDYFLPLKKEEYGFLQMDAISKTNWAPVLANIGLLIISCVECLTTIAAAFRCYWYVCRCRRRRRSSADLSIKNDLTFRYDSPDITSDSYCSSSPSKQKLVRRWLGQQQSMNSPVTSSVPFIPSRGLVPPYYTIDGKTVYPSSPFINYADYKYMMPNGIDPYYPQWPRVSLFPQVHHRTHHNSQDRVRSKRHHTERKPTPGRKKSDTLTEDDMDKTYTGLDREIAEEFISVAMDPKRLA